MEPNLKKFCSTEFSEDEHNEGLDKIVEMLNKDEVSITDVVQALGPYLTNQNELLRARGTLLLAAVLEKVPITSLDEEQLGFIVAFFKDRSRDRPCVEEVSRGMTALVKRWPIKSKAVEMLITEVYVQAHDQTTRRSLLKLVEAVLDHHLETAKQLKHDFVYGYLQMIDSERDPRNLLLVFSLTPRVLSSVQGWDRFTEELFEVTSCYYPISFTPKPGDSITPDMLQDALDVALTCTPSFCSYYYPFMLEKLSGAVDADVGGIWNSIIKSVAAFGDGGKTLLVYGEQLWKEISAVAFAASSAKSVDTMCRVTKELLAVLARDMVTSSKSETSLDNLLNPMLRTCISKLSSASSKDSSIAVRLQIAAIQGSVDCGRKVLDEVLPVLLKGMERDDRTEAEKEVLLGHVVAVVAAMDQSVKEAKISIPKKAHPLFKYGDTLFRIAKSALESSAPKTRAFALSLLCTIGAVPGLLEADFLAKAVLAVLDMCLEGPESDLDNAFSTLRSMSLRFPSQDMLSSCIPKLASISDRQSRWLQAVECLCQGGPTIIGEVWSKLLHDLCQQDSRGFDLLCRVLQDQNDGSFPDDVASKLVSDLLQLDGAAEAVRELVRLVSEEEQKEHTLKALTESFSKRRKVALAGLSSLRQGVEVSIELVDNVVRESLSSESDDICAWATRCAGNLVNKLNDKKHQEVVVQRLLEHMNDDKLDDRSKIRCTRCMGWVGRGLVLSGSELARPLLSALCLFLEQNFAEEVAQALGLCFGDTGRDLSSSATHAAVRLFARQKAFVFVVPHLALGGTKPFYLRAMTLILSQVPSSMVIGEIDSVLPLLLSSVKVVSDDANVLKGSLTVLSCIAETEAELLYVHIDTLMPTVSSFCKHKDADVRKEALHFLQVCVRRVPYAKWFPCKGKVLENVSIALDDPKREIRRIAQVLNNSMYNLN